MDQLSTHIEQLHNIILQCGELLEGNCFYYHHSLQLSPELQSKQRNLIKAASNKKQILEIGFNAGHSLLLFLQNAPKASYTVFDICEHRYTRPCFEYLQKAFPEATLTLIAGDSTITIPQFISENPTTQFDLIHVDGGHAEEVALSDMTCAINLSSPHGLIILDDTQAPNLAAIGRKFENSGHVIPAENMEETHMYQHQVYQRTLKK